MQEEGIVYVAMGERFVEEAVLSAASARRHMPSLPITLFTDVPAARGGAFDQVIETPRSGRKANRDKLACMLRSPYVRTLHLDTDTFVGADLRGLFAALAHYDLLATHDRGYVDRYPEGTEIPDAFRELNLGVVFFRRSPAMLAALGRALETYDRLGTILDGRAQPPFRIATYGSDLKTMVLTGEYNCRFTTFGQISGEVKVLHGRIPRAPHSERVLSAALARINRTTVPRVLVAGRMHALARTGRRFRRPFFAKDLGSIFPSTLGYDLKALLRRLRGSR